MAMSCTQILPYQVLKYIINTEHSSDCASDSAIAGYQKRSFLCVCD